MEEDTLGDWYYPSTGPTGYFGGGEFNSGNGDAVATGEQAHSGSQAAKLTITAPPESGTRLFRWQEPRQNREAYYSAWFLIPQSYQVPSWWSIFQFKSVNASDSRTDPFWYIVLLDNGAGGLKPVMDWWDSILGEGPHQGESGFRRYQPLAPVSVPLRRWFKLECFLRQSNSFDGRVTCWLDGTRIFDFPNVRTGYQRCTYNAWCVDNHWSVNNYSDRVLPGTATLFVDDATIAKP
jgi:hypothetical protein